MKTTDLFKNTRSAKKINESIEKTFGKKLNLESFNLEQLQDARNKLRTQIHDARSQSGFNENLENEAMTQAQWMLDAINAEIAEREEFVVDAGPAEVEEVSEDMFDRVMQAVADIKAEKGSDLDKDEFGEELWSYLDAEYGQAVANQAMDEMDNAWNEYTDSESDWNDDTDDAEALASAGFGSDEDYGDFPESIEEKAPPGAKAERMVKHIKKGYAKDGKLTDKEKSIAYATAWKQHNKEKNESTESGEDMTKLNEGEIQQASAIVTAKTMVDRVGRWIEELSGMENDTLLQLGDSIRDEMGSEQAKNFISAVAPAIQAALENLKQTRETLATGVRTLTGEEQGAEMLGAEPEEGAPEDELGTAEPDEMNMPAEEPAADEFAAAEPAAGGLGDAGREQRESIDYQNRLLKVLAG